MGNPYVGRYTLRRTLGRRVLTRAIAAVTSWPRLANPESGYSIMLGVPWDLRHLLGVNLRFIDRCDLEGLVDLHIVFDRRHREGMAEIEAEMRRRFPDLPLKFHHYRPLPGAMVEKAHVSTFYNSMNCVTALAACRTRTMILHDFDLYPLRPDYFKELARARENARFAGVERTRFDGLREEDEVYGTWALAMDAEWLRNERRPHEVFHRVAKVRGQRVSLDPFSWLELQTTRTAVGTFGPEAWCHVKNLCSTYLRVQRGERFDVAWRLHYLWYLEDLSDAGGELPRVREAIRAMRRARAADDRTLHVDGRGADFSETDATCANVLADELPRMERALLGYVRPEVDEYLEAFAAFLGDTREPARAEAA